MSEKTSLPTTVTQELLAALPEMFPGVQKIPLANIRLNPDNPGPRPTEQEITELAANIATETLKNPLKVMPDPDGFLRPGVTPHPDNPRLKADGTPWALSDFRFLNLSGELRQLACQWLKWTEIDGFILNPTPEEAVVIVRLDNQVRDKGWWADYQSLESLIKANPNLKQREIATRLRMNVRSVSWALSLLPLLNPEARGVLVSNRNMQNKGNKGISESAAFRLTALGPESTFKRGGIPDNRLQALYPYPAIPIETQDLVLRCLKAALDHQMAEPQVTKLVESVKAGQTPESFKPSATKPKSSPLPPELAEKVVELGPTPVAHANGHHPEPLAQPKHGSQLEASTQASRAKIHMVKDWLAGVKVIPQLKHKVEKGQNLTFGEAMVLGAYRLGQGLHWLWKEILKPMLKSLTEGMKKTLGKGLYNLIVLVLVCFVAWKVWNVLRIGFHPINWIESKFSHESSAPESTTAPASPSTGLTIPTAPPTVRSSELEVRSSNQKPKTSNSPLRTTNSNVVSYQPSISFLPTVYDTKYFESEIQALPQTCIVKAFPLAPDETMPGDLAASRLQDLTDTEKYTMKIGSGTEKILSAVPSNTTLTINYKSADALGGFLDGSGQMIFFWEDVTVIHSDEIDVQSKTPSTLYQCSLIVSGSKNPFTIQCASPDDLKHLVSTMEYFIRSSRLGHDTALAGMPYPSQGLKMNNQNVVEILWAGSPTDKAGLQVGDMLWSLEKNTSVPQDRKTLETALRTLTPGPHSLYAATNADFIKAQSDVAFNRASSLNPKRKKIPMAI